jgi:hypothetical protein
VAIAIRGTTPLTVATIGNPISGTLTSTRQPQTGDLLVIFVGNDWYTLATLATPTVGGSTSGVTAVTNGSADAGTNSAHVKAWTKEITSTGDVTVSCTFTGTADEEKCLAVYVLSGADVASPIDGGSAGAAGSFATPAASTWICTGVTPTGSAAYLIAHGNSGAGIAATSGVWSAGTEQYDAVITSLNYTGITQQLSASGATGTRVFDLNGTEATEWAGVLLTVKPAGGAAAPIINLTMAPITGY